MTWQKCKRCHKKILQLPGRTLPLDGYCTTCYEQATGRCADCQGTGTLNRAHLGKMECARCEGTGQAKQNLEL